MYTKAFFALNVTLSVEINYNNLNKLSPDTLLNANTIIDMLLVAPVVHDKRIPRCVDCWNPGHVPDTNE